MLNMITIFIKKILATIKTNTVNKILTLIFLIASGNTLLVQNLKVQTFGSEKNKLLIFYTVDPVIIAWHFSKQPQRNFKNKASL